MKIKLFLTIILLYSTSVQSMWLDDWYDNIKRVQTSKYKRAAKKSVETTCDRKLIEYKQLSIQNPNSKYYKWKVKSWSNRCTKERLE